MNHNMIGDLILNVALNLRAAEMDVWQEYLQHL